MRKLIPNFIAKNFLEDKKQGQFQAGVMFIDISGFTSMTEKLMTNGKEGAEILSDLINKVFSPAIKEIYNYGGFVSTFAGDAFTAIFRFKNASLENILNSSIQIRDIFQKIEMQSTKFGDFELSVKIGLSFGNVT
ncbi:MAG: adenylate/guanylate cyclase domain-containing protein [Candidatus Cloacimonetes bacterium]|nr:adenylate/guanylate cyclase domain-containing protein [Candidatus Cloacimonadota bacterium]